MKIKEIQSIIKDFESSNLMSLEIETDAFKLKLSKNKNDQVVVENENEIKTEEINQPVIQEQTVEVNTHADLTPIKSPLVGTFYAAATPKGKPFVAIGQEIKKGQVVCIIEAMKIMNEITAPTNGLVKEIVVNNGDVVGYDQVLMRVGEPG
ncbi:MAG: acetyl-CoA carboxylase biotin carboxyl carrier protein [Acholeplasmataceae bacterium]|nr:MAG: acetyl-CoA carboxylase biotin carboxyl carrier protein [Acholeplasmataceae bacterium]